MLAAQAAMAQLRLAADGHERDGAATSLVLERPASPWVQALPIGNGSPGAMVFGGSSRSACS